MQGIVALAPQIDRPRTVERGNWRGWLATAAKCAATAGVLGYLASRTDLRAVAGDVAAMSPAFLGLAIGSFLLVPVLGGLRWWALLRGMGHACRITTLTALFSTAMVFGQVLPSVAGDGFRVWLAVRRGYPMQAVIHSVLFERLAMVIALLALGVATRPLLAARIDLPGTAWIAPAALASGVFGLGLLMLADRARGRLERWRLLHLLAGLSADARRVFLSRWGGTAALVCVLSNLNFVVAAALLARALDLPVSFADMLAFVPLMTIAATLPISFGGWGVREGMLVALLGVVGVPASGALALSLTFGALGAAAGLPGLLAEPLSRRGRFVRLSAVSDIEVMQG